MKTYLLLVCLAIAGVLPHVVSAQTFIKKIIIKVTDASTNRSVEGAQVKLQGLITAKTGVTNAEGIVSFEWLLLGDEAEIKIEVTESWSHYPFKSSFIITQSQTDYTIPVSLRSNNIRFSVTVVDGSNNRPLSEAKVEVKLLDVKGNTGTTDASGTVVFDLSILQKLSSVNIIAEKQGYEKGQVSVSISEHTSQYPVTIALTRSKESKLLKVTVVDENNRAVPDAAVFAGANNSSDAVWATTDASGMATLVCKGFGTYWVKVTHDNFERSEEELTINKYGEQEVYPMQFVLKRKRAKLRNVLVSVTDEQTQKRIPGVLVNATYASASTNNNGEAYLEKVTALGEMETLTIIANGYEEKKVSYIGGGDNYRYAPPVDDRVYVSLKKSKGKDVRLIIQVLDKNTDRPIGKASVSIQNKTGTLIMSGKPTSVKGEAEMMLNKTEWSNAPFRVMAKATGYNEKWSDITLDFLNLENDPIFYTIFLEKTPADVYPGEKKYGPFEIGLRDWVSTGIQLKKGQNFRVNYDTASKITYPGSNGETVRMWPDGHGYWGWFVLAAKINNDLIHVGSKGGGVAKEDGQLLLGTPRWTEFHPEDGKTSSGSWRIYVYVREKY